MVSIIVIGIFAIIVLAVIVGVAAYLIMGTWSAFLIFLLASFITFSVCLTLIVIIKYIIQKRKK